MIMPVQKSHTAGCQPLAIANCLETADIQNQLFHVNQKRKDIMAKMQKAQAVYLREMFAMWIYFSIWKKNREHNCYLQIVFY